jgi:hypothetical protein
MTGYDVHAVFLGQCCILLGSIIFHGPVAGIVIGYFHHRIARILKGFEGSLNIGFQAFHGIGGYPKLLLFWAWFRCKGRRG